MVKTYERRPEDDHIYQKHFIFMQKMVKSIVTIYFTCFVVSVIIFIHCDKTRDMELLFEAFNGVDVRIGIGAPFIAAFYILICTGGLMIHCLYDSIVVFIFINIHVISLMIVERIEQMEIELKGEIVDGSDMAKRRLIDIIEFHQQYNR